MREKKLSVRLGDKLHAEIKKRAEKYNQSISEYVRNLLIKNIEKEENKIKNRFKFDIPSVWNADVKLQEEIKPRKPGTRKVDLEETTSVVEKKNEKILKKF